MKRFMFWAVVALVLIVGVVSVSRMKALGSTGKAIVNNGGAADGRARYYWPVAVGERVTLDADVVVYGGTPGGVAAAIQASRMGCDVVLASFNRHVGGLSSGGLTATDIGNRKSIGGIANEFYERLGKSSGFSSTEAESLFLRMLREARVRVLFERRLESVKMDGNRIVSVKFENGETIEASVFVDTTYEGDLFAAAGVSYRVGREASSTYGENLNGVLYIPDQVKCNFVVAVDPFVEEGKPDSGLLAEISRESSYGNHGDGDAKVQAYNFRMILSDAPDRVPFAKPEGYNPQTYRLLTRYIETDENITWKFEYAWTPMHDGPVRLRNGDCNNAGAFSTDYIGASYRWPDGTYTPGSSASPIPVRRGLQMPLHELYELRETIFQDHVDYQQGFMYFLANDPGVPAWMREKVSGFGLKKSEFVETGNWPHQLYVREGRRMVSDYVMTQDNCESKRVALDSVGLASYAMDSHSCQRVVVERDGRQIVRNEGIINTRTTKPYAVSYRSIVSRKSECANLIVPVCLSATHIAYGSIRMEPVFMILGQSAGTAAWHAIEGGLAVQDVPYAALRQQLLKDGQILVWSEEMTGGSG